MSSFPAGKPGEGVLLDLGIGHEPRFEDAPQLPAESGSKGFAHKELVAELLDSLASAALKNTLRQAPEQSLREAYEGLTSQQKERLRTKLGPSLLGKIFSLSQEGDARLFNRGFLGVAARLQERGNSEAALEAYQKLSSRKISEELAQEIERGRNRILGGGDIGEQVDAFFDQGVDHLLDVPMLAGMVAGGFSYRMFRALGAGLLFRPTLPLTTAEYWAGRALLNTSSLLGESAVFTGTIKGTQILLGREVDLSSEAWAHEFGGAVTMLGSLRLFGSGAAFIGKSLPRVGRLGKTAISNGGMYLGIVNAQLLDQGLGIVPSTHEGVDLFDAFLTLLHFQGAGFMVRAITPKWIKQKEKELELQTEQVLQRAQFSGLLLAGGPAIPPEVLQQLTRPTQPRKGDRILHYNEGGDGKKSREGPGETLGEVKPYHEIVEATKGDFAALETLRRLALAENTLAIEGLTVLSEGRVPGALVVLREVAERVEAARGLFQNVMLNYSLEVIPNGDSGKGGTLVFGQDWAGRSIERTGPAGLEFFVHRLGNNGEFSLRDAVGSVYQVRPGEWGETSHPFRRGDRLILYPRAGGGAPLPGEGRIPKAPPIPSEFFETLPKDELLRRVDRQDPDAMADLLKRAQEADPEAIQAMVDRVVLQPQIFLMWGNLTQGGSPQVHKVLGQVQLGKVAPEARNGDGVAIDLLRELGSLGNRDALGLLSRIGQEGNIQAIKDLRELSESHSEAKKLFEDAAQEFSLMVHWRGAQGKFVPGGVLAFQSRSNGRATSSGGKSYTVTQLGSRGRIQLTDGSGISRWVDTQRVVDPYHPFSKGDRVTLFPKIAGGAPGPGESPGQKKFTLNETEGLGRDLYSLMGEKPSLAETHGVPELSRDRARFMEEIFEEGGAILNFPQGPSLIRLASGAQTIDFIEPASKADIAFYELWQGERGFTRASFAQAERAWWRLQKRSRSLGIHLQFNRELRRDPARQSGGMEKIYEDFGHQIVVLNQLLELLPDSLLKTHKLTGIHLNTDRMNAGGLGSYEAGRAFLYEGTFSGSRRHMLSVTLHELGHGTAQRYFLKAEESSEYGMEPQFRGESGDSNINVHIREKMHWAHRVLAEQDALLGLDFAGGPLYRVGYQSNHLPDFIADLHVAYVAAGPRLRSHIQSYLPGTPVREAWDFVYSELKDRIFNGREYGYQGVKEASADAYLAGGIEVTLETPVSEFPGAARRAEAIEITVEAPVSEFPGSVSRAEVQGYEVAISGGGRKFGTMVAAAIMKKSGQFSQHLFTVEAVTPTGEMVLTNEAGQTLLARGITDSPKPHNFKEGDAIILIPGNAGGSNHGDPPRGKFANIQGLTEGRAEKLREMFADGYQVFEEGGKFFFVIIDELTLRYKGKFPASGHDFEYYLLWRSEQGGPYTDKVSLAFLDKARPSQMPPMRVPPRPPSIPPIKTSVGPKPPPLRRASHRAENVRQRQQKMAEALIAFHNSGTGIVSETHLRSAKEFLDMMEAPRGQTPPPYPSFMEAMRQYAYPVVWNTAQGVSMRGSLQMADLTEGEGAAGWKCKVLRVEAWGRLVLRNPQGRELSVQGPGNPPLAHPFAVGDTLRIIPVVEGAAGKPQQGGASFLSGNHFQNPLLAELLGRNLSERYGSGLLDPNIRDILTRVDRTPFYYEPDLFGGHYFELMRDVRVSDFSRSSGETLPPLEGLARGTQILQHVMTLDALRTGTGSLYDSLVQVALERTLEHKNPEAFADLLQTVVHGEGIPGLEKFFQRQEWSLSYQVPELSRSLAGRTQFWKQRLKAMGFSEGEAKALNAYLAAYSYGNKRQAFWNPHYNFIWMGRSAGQEQGAPLDAAHILDILERSMARNRGDGEWLGHLKKAVNYSAQSSLPLLYFDRIVKSLARGDGPERILEIGSPRSFDLGRLLERMGPLNEENLPKIVRRLDGGVYTGYVRDPSLAEKFARFYYELPFLLQGEAARDNRRAFDQHAERILRGKVNITRDDILDLLELRPNPLAREALRTIREGELDFEVFTREEMDLLWKEINPGRIRSEPPQGFFLPPEHSPTKRSFIAIQELDPKLNHGQRVRAVLRTVAFALHEYEHYRHYHQLDTRSPAGLLRSEMRSWLAEQEYLLMQGETRDWQEALRLSPEGFGVHLRKRIEFDYLQGPRDFVMRK